MAKQGSSKRWQRRQSKDYYVRRAGELGYQSRAAFKLAQIAEKNGFFAGAKELWVLDLGAAPGSWTQYILQQKPQVKLVSVDILEMEIGGHIFICSDIKREGLAAEILKNVSGGSGLMDLVLSDLSPSLTGNRSMDQLRSEQLALDAYELAAQVLKTGGSFLVKLRQGGTAEIETILRENFENVKYEKPDASRSESAEIYLLASKWKN